MDYEFKRLVKLPLCVRCHTEGCETFKKHIHEFCFPKIYILVGRKTNLYMKNFGIREIFRRIIKDSLGRDIQLHLVFMPPVTFCKAVDSVHPPASKGKSIPFPATKIPTFLALSEQTVLHFLTAVWHSPISLEINTDRAQPLLCVAAISQGYSCGFMGLNMVIYCILSPLLGCEIPEGEDCVSFISLLLIPCTGSGIELVFSNFDLHLIVLN